MRKRLFSILQYFIFLGGGIFLVWWQLKSMTEDEKIQFYHAFGLANYWLVIPVAVMSLLSHISRAMRWKLLMEPLGYKPSLKNTFATTMIGYLANAAVPRLGEILKCTFLARYEHLKVDKLVGTILIERAFDFFCFLLFISLTVLIQIDTVSGFLKTELHAMAASPGLPLWAKLLIVVVLAFSLLLLVKYLFKKYPGNKVVYTISNFLRGIIEGFKSIKNLKHRKLFLLHTLFIWTMYLMQIYIGFSSMEGTSHLGIKAACSVLTLATFAMIATPGGIGSFPLFVMKTLAMYSILEPLGKAFGWLMWGVSTGIVIIAGFTALIILPYLNKNKNEVSSGNTSEDI